MTYSELRTRLQALRPLLDRHRVKRLDVFGSVVRGDATPDSDIDLIVEFDGPASLFDLLRLRAALADAFGRPVDLATFGGLQPRYRERILREARRAA